MKKEELDKLQPSYDKCAKMLINKAMESEKADDALKFSQAALNVIMTLHELATFYERKEKKWWNR